MAMHHAALHKAMKSKLWPTIRADIINHRTDNKPWEVLISSSAANALPQKSFRFEILTDAITHAETVLGINYGHALRSEAALA